MLVEVKYLLYLFEEQIMYLGKDHQVKLNDCPSCGYTLDGATQINGDNLPQPGDFSVCARCGRVHVFDKQMKLRFPSAKEQKIIDDDPVILHAQRAIFLAHVELEAKKNLH